MTCYDGPALQPETNVIIVDKMLSPIKSTDTAGINQLNCTVMYGAITITSEAEISPGIWQTDYYRD